MNFTNFVPFHFDVMTHYYCLIIAGDVIDESSLIYKVGVGTSKQCNRDYLFLLAHAVDHGWYFEKWSAEVREFVRKIAESLSATNSNDPSQAISIHGASVREIVRSIKNGTAFPSSSNELTNRNQLRQWLSLNYRIGAIRQGEATSLPAE